MYQTVNESAFIEAFESIRPENFSRPALRELFSYYENLEDNLGEEIELDPIAICCDWTEYTEDELLSEYSECVDEEFDVSDLADETTVIVVDHFEEADTYLVLSF